MVCPSTYPRSRSLCRKASMRDAAAEKELGMSSPRRGTCAAGCAWDVSGGVSRLRLSVTMPPIVLPHIVISSRQPHADLVLSIEAERSRSPAAGSRSEARAEAGGSQVQCNVRCGTPSLPHSGFPCHLLPDAARHCLWEPGLLVPQRRQPAQDGCLTFGQAVVPLWRPHRPSAQAPGPFGA